MGEHAKLSPSSSDRWTTCTASPAIEARYPEQETSSFAQEGTDAHDLLERAVKAVTRPSELEPDHPACKDVDLCYDLVSPFLNDPNYVIYSELKVELCKDVYGTADIVAIGENTLVVCDYKHGRGVIVEVPSTQLEIYAAAALKSIGFMAPEPIERVITTIVQPRAEHPAGPIRRKAYTVPEIEARGEEVIAIAFKINNNEVKVCPSEKACKWCRASGNCQAQADLAIELSGFKPIDVNSEPAPVKELNDLTLDEKVHIHLSKGFITDFLNAVSLGLEKALLAGEEVPGLKVVAGQSRRKWADLTEEEIIRVLTEECKLRKADFMPPKLVTGPAALKLIDVKKKNGRKKLEALNAIIVKPEGKPTVVSEDDPRDSIAPMFKPAETGNPLD